MAAVSNVGVNIAEKATLIWNVADMLRGPFKPHEYGLVILPMTVVKRFHDCLLPTHQAVLTMYERVKHMEVVEGFLTRASGYQFYNTSKYTFETLLADPENIEANFRDYLSGFSANVQDVLAKFEFDNIIKRMVESNTLYLVIKEFNSPMGSICPFRQSTVMLPRMTRQRCLCFTSSMISQSCWVLLLRRLTSVQMSVSPSLAASNKRSRFFLILLSPCSRSVTISCAPAALSSRT